MFGWSCDPGSTLSNLHGPKHHIKRSYCTEKREVPLVALQTNIYNNNKQQNVYLSVINMITEIQIKISSNIFTNNFYQSV